MSQVISTLDQVTPGWLTAILYNCGTLTEGAVAYIDVDTRRGNWSTNTNLNVQYVPGSQGTLPQRLFLKIVDTDLDDEFFGPSEVAYYTHDYVGVEDAPLIRCYDAVYSEEQQRYHLLLDDMSDTHVEAAEKPPTLAFGLALAEGLAVMHAHRWGADRLAEACTPIHPPYHIQRFVDISEPGARHIINQFSEHLKPHWPEMIRSLYARHPQVMIERTRDENGFTRIHGDVGHNNILVPCDGNRPLYIIDRQPFDWSLTTWLGVYDLAYAIVLDWEVETRRQLEIPILKHYHRHLHVKGVKDYTWEQLVNDYRLCAAMGVYIATEYCRGGINAAWQGTWLPMLQRALTACDDLHCDSQWQ